MLTDRARHPAHRFPQPPPTARMYRTIAFSFLGLAVAIGGIVIWFSSGRADVVIRVKRETATLDTTIDVAKSPEQGQLRGRVVDGTFDTIREFAVDASASVASAPVTVATTTGRVRITNKYSKEQPLIKTTRLQTADGKLFRLKTNVTVPAGGSVEADAYSDKPGNDSLIKSGTTFAIPGLWIDLRKLITAQAITDFTGNGSSTSSKTVSAEQVDRAYAQLQTEVVDKAKGTLLAQAGIPAERLAADCPETQDCWEAVYVVKVIEKKTNVTVGQSSDSFLAQVKAKVTAVYYPKKDVQMLLLSKLKERVSEGREIVEIDPTQTSLTLMDADASREYARIKVAAVATSRLTEQSPSISAAAIAGLSVDDARRQLMAVNGVETVQINLRPTWASRIPSQADKINITIE